MSNQMKAIVISGTLFCIMFSSIIYVGGPSGQALGDQLRSYLMLGAGIVAIVSGGAFCILMARLPKMKLTDGITVEGRPLAL